MPKPSVSDLKRIHILVTGIDKYGNKCILWTKHAFYIKKTKTGIWGHLINPAQKHALEKRSLKKYL